MNSPKINININTNKPEPETPTFKSLKKHINFSLSNEEFPPLSMDEKFDNDYINPGIIDNNLNNNNNLDLKYINPTHNVDTRLKDVDQRIFKFSDFHSISYFMFFWSILCFLLSIWDITHLSNYQHIKFLNDIKKEIENFKCLIKIINMGITCTNNTICNNEGEENEEDLNFCYINKIYKINYEPKNAKFYEKIPEYDNIIQGNIIRKQSLTPNMTEYSNGNVHIINM